MKLLVCALLYFSLILTACTTQVKNLKTDQDTGLTDGKGYLFMAVDTNTDLEKIDIEGTKYAQITKTDLLAGSNFILFELPAGNYQFYKISKKYAYFNLKNKNDYWSFTITDGVISYIGTLVAKSNFLFADFEMLNQSSIALEYLESNFPNLLKERKIIYAGPGEDNFLNFVSNK